MDQVEVPHEKKQALSDKIVDCVLYNHDYIKTAIQIKEHIDRQDYSEFNDSALNWLIYRVEFIQKILESDQACGVFYWLLKTQETKRNFSVYFISYFDFTTY